MDTANNSTTPAPSCDQPQNSQNTHPSPNDITPTAPLEQPPLDSTEIISTILPADHSANESSDRSESSSINPSGTNPSGTNPSSAQPSCSAPTISSTEAPAPIDDEENSAEEEEQIEETYDVEAFRCNICRSPHATDDNPLVFCEKCDLGVHQQCYGAPLTSEIPEEEWICDRCQAHAEDESCALCPQTTGIMKRTSDWRWAHLSCAMWIPETFFRMPDGLDCIDYLQVPSHRFQRHCMHCDSSEGATMTCSTPGCQNRFHITCGMKEDIYLSYQSQKKGTDLIVALCADHTRKMEHDDKKKEGKKQSNNSSSTVSASGSSNSSNNKRKKR